MISHISKIFSVICLLTAVMLTIVPEKLMAQQSELKADSSEVNVRLADPDRLSKYRSDLELTYDERPERSDSFIGLIISEIANFLDGMMGGETSGFVIRIIFVLLLIGVIYLLLNQVLKGNIRKAFYGKSASEAVRFQRDPGVESEENLDRLIEKAVTIGNYREAVRLTYQKSLRDLSRAGMIEWAINKTNQEYIYETEPHPAAGPLRKLTRIYDYTEYGDFGIDSNGFSGVTDSYTKLKNLLQQDEDSTKHSVDGGSRG